MKRQVRSIVGGKNEMCNMSQDCSTPRKTDQIEADVWDLQRLAGKERGGKVIMSKIIKMRTIDRHAKRERLKHSQASLRDAEISYEYEMWDDETV